MTMSNLTKSCINESPKEITVSYCDKSMDVTGG
jgi:hypothetical protein